jgi:hypothetical protein
VWSLRRAVLIFEAVSRRSVWILGAVSRRAVWIFSDDIL